MQLVRTLAVALCMLSPVEADAETFTGSVKDESGGIVVSATITVLTARQAVVATTVSDTGGNFTIATLAAGDYVVQVDASGFSQRRIAATVHANSPPLSIVLDVGAVRESVTVTAPPGYAQDSVKALQPVTVIGREQLDQRVTRFVAEAVQEEAGVHLQNTSPTMSGVFVRGLTGNKVNIFVDGVRYSNGAQRGGVNTFLNLIDPSVIDGIEVVHGPNSAEYGSDALGGTVQFFTKTPELAASGTRVGGEFAVGGQTAHEGGGANAALSFGTTKFGLFASGGGRKAGEIRVGDGIDSHAAATRFLGVPSNVVMDERLPNTGSQQFAGMLKANWTPSSRTQIVSAYTGTRQDKAHRYDQELGGDGNLISELNDMTLDLFYARLERSGLGWFDHGTLHLFDQQPARRARQPGRPGQPHRGDRATSRNGPRPTRCRARSTSRSRARQSAGRRRHPVREADLGFVQRQPGHGRASRRGVRACRATRPSTRVACTRRPHSTRCPIGCGSSARSAPATSSYEAQRLRCAGRQRPAAVAGR